MGDLPDWTQATSNAGTVLENGFVNAGVTFGIDVSNNNSLVIAAAGVAVNTKIVLTLQWFTDATQTVSVSNATVTCVAVVGIQGQVEFETPVYSGYLTIANGPSQNIGLTIIGASRFVPAPRLLNSSTPGKTFAFTGVFVAATAVTLVATDGGTITFSSNGSTTINCQSNTAGTVFVSYVRWDGTLTSYPILSVAAGSFAVATMALPQSAIGFLFVPSAPNAAGNVAVNVAAAQL